MVGRRVVRVHDGPHASLRIPDRLLLLVAATPAAAQEKVCRGQHAPKPPPTPAEKEQAELEHYAAAARGVRIPARHPVRKELIRRGVWEYDVSYFPVTPAENRYCDCATARLGPQGAPVPARAPGGRGVDLGRGRLAARAVHARALQAQRRPAPAGAPAARPLPGQPARDPDPVQRAGPEAAQRTDLARRGPNCAAPASTSIGTGIGSNRAHVDVITKRTDAVEYFRKHYGPA